jgi:predicted glycoside hydrolase/deacetylase ChbG (UPF0249 family)
MTRSLLIICDDAGFASVERGILRLVRETGVPICADYMLEQDGAVERMRAMAMMPNVSIGLHAELLGSSDAERHVLGKKLQSEGSSLGLQPEIREQALRDTRRQVELFRKVMGRDPAHIGTHGNFHVDADGKILRWWEELMNDLFGEHAPPQQCAVPIIRHHMYSWNIEPTAREPRTPDEFRDELTKFSDHEAVEFVLHPAVPEPGDTSLDMLFTAEMRVRDVEAAIAILNSDAIARAGFSVKAL